MGAGNLFTLWILFSYNTMVCLTTCPHLSVVRRASDKSTWPSGFSINNRNITLDFPLLLDLETPRLAGVTIVAGGRLVFSPTASLAKLVTDYVKIEEGGSLEIGSQDCPFQGRAEIMLTGRRGSYETEDGEKFISVHAGGSLEIHGEPKVSWTRLARTVSAGGNNHTLQVVDDVSSWSSGDKLVLASTDFDMDQAEVITVQECKAKSCMVSGIIQFPHFGMIDSGVDMRGEVGLLSRNILIHGEMEKNCYGEQLCDEYDFDTFGGHIIAREGFKSFKVENAELTKLGQQGIVGRYPLHWHMAGNLTLGTSYVRKNSIHHTLQRCVTCHGSFGCQIENNVAFESLGHCYFMEDGVERGTLMKNNLGLNTRKGSMIPSDSDPATFWITHPDSYITKNTAGGSEGKGFWFLQAALPTGDSGELQAAGDKHFFSKDELFRTKLGDISGNTAHSSSFGFFFDSVLLPDQGTNGQNSGRFAPVQDIKNPKSEKLTSHISDITCYKAEQTCVWMHLDQGEYDNIRVADSREGMFVHETSHITNSLFVGESEKNFGVPNRRVNRKLWHRSLPRGKASVGFRNYVNPTLLENSVFQSFQDSDARFVRAISPRRTGPKSLFTGAKNVSFINTPIKGRMGEKEREDRQFLYYDWSGSITGAPGSYIVKNLPHQTSGLCQAMPEWGPLSICPHHYVSLPIGRGRGDSIVLTRTDLPQHRYTPHEKDNMIYIISDHTYIISFKNNIPTRDGRRPKIPLKVTGVDNGTSLILGLCMPLGAEFKIKNNNKVASFEKLKGSDEGNTYFHDTSAGVVFMKVKGTYRRKQGETDPCGEKDEACIMKVENSSN